MNIFKKIFFILSTITFISGLVPVLSFAQVTTGGSNTGITYVCVSGQPGDCTFAELVEAVKKVTNYGTIFALQFSVVVIAYAGFIYMNSGGSASERSRANKMFQSVVIGIVLIIAAWLIVTLILNALGVNNIVNLG